MIKKAIYGLFIASIITGVSIGATYALDASVADTRSHIAGINSIIQSLQNKIQTVTNDLAAHSTLLTTTRTRLTTAEAALVTTQNNLNTANAELLAMDTCANLSKIYTRTSGCVDPITVAAAPPPPTPTPTPTPTPAPPPPPPPCTCANNTYTYDPGSFNAPVSLTYPAGACGATANPTVSVRIAQSYCDISSDMRGVPGTRVVTRTAERLGVCTAPNIWTTITYSYPKDATAMRFLPGCNL